MRYTTIIDIRDFPEVYSNKNAVLLYLHLCLRAGYHAEDRDIVAISVRRLASEVGITYSAARHALAVLRKHQLVFAHTSLALRVCKFVVPTEIPQRSSARKTIEQERFEEQMRITREENRKNEERRKKAADERASPLEVLAYFEQKAKSGDARAKKEAAEFRQLLVENGTLKQ